MTNLFVVDVVKIGESRAKIGQVLKVKPLAALAMIDEGELDWKIVAISLDDPRASLVNDIDDVEKHFLVCFECNNALMFFTLLYSHMLIIRQHYMHHQFLALSFWCCYYQ